ncbi:nucleotide-binding alpha-beta plait domain-containing protein, partial [Tanacetum coccineum]
VLQNAGDIIENNGLVDCKVKYCGGLTLLFEWGSKDSARVCMEENMIWMTQWFENLKPWEENDSRTGRLTWVYIEGLPILGRHLGAVKSIVKRFGRVLETGRLDINSKIIVPVKALMLVSSMDDVKRSLSITLNGNIYNIRIYEEPYPVSNLLSYGRDSDLEVDTMFEEEFIGPTMVEEDDGGKEFSGDLYPRASGTEKVYVSPSPCMENIKSNGARLDGDFNNNKHGNSSPCNMNNDTHESNFVSSESPRTSGLPPPPFTKSVSAQSFVEESYGPAQGNSWDFLCPNVWRERDPRDCLVSSDSNVAFAYSGSVGASGDRHLKEALWSSIESLLNSVNITWIVFGDFNVVRSQEERSGCRFNHGKANIFNDFIYRCRLFDFPLGGRKFTRFDRDGAKASKLDRFLANQEFFELWKDASVSVLPRTISDHCPILLKRFDILVLACYNRCYPPDILLKNKLKALRMDIKKWSADRVASDNQRREEISKNLAKWDERLEKVAFKSMNSKGRNGSWICSSLTVFVMRT